MPGERPLISQVGKNPTAWQRLFPWHFRLFSLCPKACYIPFPAQHTEVTESYPASDFAECFFVTFFSEESKRPPLPRQNPNLPLRFWLTKAVFLFCRKASISPQGFYCPPGIGGKRPDRGHTSNFFSANAPWSWYSGRIGKQGRHNPDIPYAWKSFDSSPHQHAHIIPPIWIYSTFSILFLLLVSIFYRSHINTRQNLHSAGLK